ncbi:type 1 fimbrial protein [Serratia rubidaea]|uniref:fimbrial protein n=1 Tax=Serratia rubidaea TaxID=61652 RepID=UPI001F188DC9|nr:fimbrial protein [Serratia rubidaea]UJD79462.1 type 1 fimbrial protein [Serratia rubidaea]UJD84017.1 type 1 fimbrial protein [Serratia rubidaea]
MRHRGFSIVLLYLLALPVTSWASNQGAGRVRMQGSIIDTPCAIDVDSRDQSVDMSVLPFGQIMHDGRGPSRPFSIRLVNCVLAHDNPNRPDWSTFRVTFDGPSSDGSLFALSGQGRGIGVLIADDAGNTALPGKQMPPGNLHADNMMLNYTIRLVADRKPLRAGEYRATIRFKLDYY